MTDSVKLLDWMIAQLKTFDAGAEQAKSRAEAALQREMESSTRIRGWLVAASAGALLICFNTLLSGKICEWSVFRPLVFVFVGGVAGAFGSVLADRRGHAVYRLLMSNAVAVGTGAVQVAGKLEATRAIVASGDEQNSMNLLTPIGDEISTLNKRASKIAKINVRFWSSTSDWLEFGSVVALASGLIWAVSDSAFVGALCLAH